MIQEEYISLIKAMSELTNKDVIKWSKGDSYFSYYSFPTGKERILIDKYYSIVDDQKGACLNMAIFNQKNEIIDEVVSCNLEEEDSESFQILNDLYNKVEEQVQKINSDRMSPILNDITESLQQKINAP